MIRKRATLGYNNDDYLRECMHLGWCDSLECLVHRTRAGMGEVQLPNPFPPLRPCRWATLTHFFFFFSFFFYCLFFLFYPLLFLFSFWFFFIFCCLFLYLLIFLSFIVCNKFFFCKRKTLCQSSKYDKCTIVYHFIYFFIL